MDINFFLALIIVAVVASIPYYLLYKRDRDIINELLKKINDEKVVTLPWADAVNNPEASAKDDDHVPLEEVDDEKLMDIIHENIQVKDREAEEAQKEIN